MLGGRERVLKNNAFSLYDSYGHALAQEPLPRCHEILKFGRLFLGHQYYTLMLSEPYVPE